jgi:hypothetical protein
VHPVAARYSTPVAAASNPTGCHSSPRGWQGQCYSGWLTPSQGRAVAIGLGLTFINVLQVGLDPATDGLEVGVVAGDEGAAAARTLAGSTGEPAAGAGPEWAMKSGEEVQQTRESDENLREGVENLTQTIEALRDQPPSGWQADVPTSSGQPIITPETPVATGDVHSNAAVAAAIAARTIAIAIERIIGG